MTDEDLIGLLPPTLPQTRLVWTAIVDIAERQDLGDGPQGHRYIVPILGGRFYPGPDMPGLQGIVVAGGADRQLLRRDGIKELDALYEMRTDEGAVLTVHNRVTIDESRAPERYAISTIAVRAPDGPHAWLNRRVLVGTLQSNLAQRMAVVVRVWLVDTLPPG